MQISFCGVRGSSPTPFREHLRYGGNTSCVEVRTDENEICIFDAGTGLRALGKRLVREFGFGRIEAAVFFSHYHWDHIQGIPMFEPLYHPDNHFYFYSFPSHSYPVEEALEGQMRDPYFPVNMAAMRAVRSFHNLNDDVIHLGRTTIYAKRLNHPQGCLGYRVESPSGVAVYATDNEPGEPAFDRNLRDLAEGADILICDSQYTPVEYANYRRGWGHSTWLEAARVAADARVRQLVLYHHDPDHNDRFLDSILEEARKHFPNVAAASETLEVNLPAEVQRHRLKSNDRRYTVRCDLSLPAVVEGVGANGLSFVENTVVDSLSFAGASFVLDHEPHPARQLLLHVKLSGEPMSDAETIELESQIVRSEKKDDHRSHVAVRFPTMKPRRSSRTVPPAAANADD